MGKWDEIEPNAIVATRKKLSTLKKDVYKTDYDHRVIQSIEAFLSKWEARREPAWKQLLEDMLSERWGLPSIKH